MAQVTELKVYGTMGGLYGRSFSGKTAEAGVTITVQPRQEDERLVRVPLVSILLFALVVLWL